MELKYPVVMINGTYFDVASNVTNLQTVTLHAFNRRVFVNMQLIDASGKLVSVAFARKIKVIGPLWRFFVFNPLLFVEFVPNRERVIDLQNFTSILEENLLLSQRENGDLSFLHKALVHAAKKSKNINEAVIKIAKLFNPGE